MAREYFERQNSTKRSSQRSSSAGPFPRQPQPPNSNPCPPPQDEPDYRNRKPSAQLRNQAFVEEIYRRELWNQNSRDHNQSSQDQGGHNGHPKDGYRNYPDGEPQQYNNDHVLEPPRSSDSARLASERAMPNNSNTRRDQPPERASERRRNQRDLDTDDRIPVTLPAYMPPPRWLPHDMRSANSDYETDTSIFMPRMVTLTRKATGQVFGFDIRGGSGSTQLSGRETGLAGDGSDHGGEREGLHVHQFPGGLQLPQVPGEATPVGEVLPSWIQNNPLVREIARHIKKMDHFRVDVRTVN